MCTIHKIFPIVFAFGIDFYRKICYTIYAKQWECKNTSNAEQKT